MSKPLRTFGGSMVALVTPFNQDESVNYEKLTELVDFHLINKTDGLVVLGTTAETPTLSDEEKTKIAKQVIDYVAGRIPVIIGAGSNDTKHAVQLAQLYESLGADGLLCVTPYYNKANKSGMLAHFEAISDAVNIPIILYNVPGRTGCSIPLDVMAILAKRQNIVGVKEASGDISYVTKCARLVSDEFCLLSGNDDMIVPLMAVGGIGVISVLANVAPLQTHNLVAEFLAGNIQKSRELQLELLDLVDALFIENNPAPVKRAMELMGLATGPCRLPTGPMDEGNVEKLKNALKILGK